MSFDNSKYKPDKRATVLYNVKSDISLKISRINILRTKNISL